MPAAGSIPATPDVSCAAVTLTRPYSWPPSHVTLTVSAAAVRMLPGEGRAIWRGTFEHASKLQEASVPGFAPAAAHWASSTVVLEPATKSVSWQKTARDLVPPPQPREQVV